jgi:hypothetical protein
MDSVSHDPAVFVPLELWLEEDTEIPECQENFDHTQKILRGLYQGDGVSCYMCGARFLVEKHGFSFIRVNMQSEVM